MTFCISVGRWGGFYWCWDGWTNWRLCLGWIALTAIPEEIDDWLALSLAALEGLDVPLTDTAIPHAEDILEWMEGW